MKPKPILFTGEMVNAILEGRKTQTRRVIKPQPDPCKLQFTNFDILPRNAPYKEGQELWVKETWVFKGFHTSVPSDHFFACVEYVADGKTNYDIKLPNEFLHKLPKQNTENLELARDSAETEKDYWFLHEKVEEEIHKHFNKKRSPMFMPKWASRIKLKVTNVRAERVQDISEADAIAEGCKADGGISSSPMEAVEYDGYTVVEDFSTLWDSIHAKPKHKGDHYQSYPFSGDIETPYTVEHKGKPHDITPNCWVWIVEFEVTK